MTLSPTRQSNKAAAYLNMQQLPDLMPYLEPAQLIELLIRIQAAHVATHSLYNAIRSKVIETPTLTPLGIITSYRLEVVLALLEPQVEEQLHAQGLVKDPIIDLLRCLYGHVNGVTRTICGIPVEPDAFPNMPTNPPIEQLPELTHSVMVKLAELADQVRSDLECFNHE